MSVVASGGITWARLVSSEIEAVQVHDLAPGGDEVTHERLLRVLTPVRLRDGTELGVRAEDEVDRGGGPLHLAGRPIPALVHRRRGAVPGRAGSLPLRAHVEQVDEEIVRQRLGPVGEDAMP